MAFRIISACLLLACLLLGEAWAAKPRCGDGKCSGLETPESCPADCYAPPPAACNLDGVCNEGEDCNSCPDCPGVTVGKPKNRYCCGLDSCDTGLCGANACDPVPECGNGVAEYSEECDDGNGDAGDGCDPFCVIEAPPDPAPLNQFNIGDSIGEGEAANGTIGEAHHESVWSTGYAAADGVHSLNERFEVIDPAGYTENNAGRDPAINQAISGSVMANFQAQAQAVAAQMGSVPPGTAGMVTVLLGNNDVCASSLAAMTDPAVFEAQYRAGLDVLSEAPFSDSLSVLISGLPAIYWLWESKRTEWWCRVVAWPFVPCENLLANPEDDCASAASRLDPNHFYEGDGENCIRRKQFHGRIRDDYNPILEGVLNEYKAEGKLLNAEYVDIFDVRFFSYHVNGGDCFHPNRVGHSLMAEEQWCRSRWGGGQCSASGASGE